MFSPPLITIKITIIYIMLFFHEAGFLSNTLIAPQILSIKIASFTRGTYGKLF
ncbi:hypothetical protein OG21DRAFT_1492119 [Imleria badia]|nr:hypothetical protein OG21DRAFT_1492119 [Imleria badia]